MKISKKQYDNLSEHLKQYFTTGNIHPTTKNVVLMSYLITLGSREGDIVLDPFLGSGTTAISAESLGRKWVGIEKELSYVEIAKARIEKEQSQPELSKQRGGGKYEN